LRRLRLVVLLVVLPRVATRSSLQQEQCALARGALVPSLEVCCRADGRGALLRCDPGWPWGLGGQARSEHVCVCRQGWTCVYRVDKLRFPPCAHGIYTHGTGRFDMYGAWLWPLAWVRMTVAPGWVGSVPALCPKCVCELGEAPLPRVVFASLPRSGNSWSRDMIELSTGIVTETVFHESFRAFQDGIESPRQVSVGGRGRERERLRTCVRACVRRRGWDGHAGACGQVCCGRAVPVAWLDWCICRRMRPAFTRPAGSLGTRAATCMPATASALDAMGWWWPRRMPPSL
jgi:hypothetical protein